MKNEKKELLFLRTFAITTSLGILAFASIAFKQAGNKRFGTIDVERINIIEKDGTTKMIITNVAEFPNDKDSINHRPTNVKRKKRAGMLFFNEDGIECGGLIYDGKRKENEHSSGLSLTFDKYDGDQAMQLLHTDSKRNGQRRLKSSIRFNDLPENSTQATTAKAHEELDKITDKKIWRKTYNEYVKQGILGITKRMEVGNLGKGRPNGMFLYDDEGNMRAMFCIDSKNNVRLEVFDQKGNKVNSWPTKK
ncbi:hypothetical protein [Aquimarina sp. 2201CG5-10]|uniref:hypothetical protein n=1 Tax=Aquimarina callyspongiae TaxID=3098150 RepID=UPI002AB3C0BB|nr:hypothetical protein [Aquimarina sp. 2201CG5-10]MDY8137468.1 hypothetical protein [Aquimarina sp. 2201CG5-10]